MNLFIPQDSHRSPTTTAHTKQTSSQRFLRFKETHSILILAKPIFTRATTWIFCKEIMNSAQLCSEYFSWNTKTALALGMTVTNIFLGSMVPILQRAFREFINTAINHPNESDLYLYPLINLLNIIFSIAVVHSINAVLCKKLRDDLGFEMRNKLLKLWVETKADASYTTITAGSKIKDSSYDLVFMTKILCEHLVNLANARLSTLSYFLGALRSLYINSAFVQISLLGLTLEIPYLILVCFIYVYGYNFASLWTDSVFKKNIEDENNTLNDLNAELNKIKSTEQDQSISSYLLKDLTYMKINKYIHDINVRSLLPQSGLSFLNKFNAEISMVIGAIVQLFTGSIDPINIVNTAQNFAYAAVQASWQRTQLDRLKALENAAERIENINAVINELRGSVPLTGVTVV